MLMDFWRFFWLLSSLLAGTVSVCSWWYEGWDALRIEALVVHAQTDVEALRYDEALGRIDMAMGIRADDARLYTVRGTLTMLLYEWDGALADLNRAVALDETYAPAYYHRGILYATVLEQAKAVADFEAYLSLAPDGRFSEEVHGYLNRMR